MERVLLVDDSVDCQLMVSRALHGAVHVSVASDLEAARRLLESEEYDLLLLDVDLPDGDGFGLCSTLMAQKGGRRPRIVFLTGATELADRLTGFSVGGDDYVVKPFDPLELKARVQAHLRVSREAQEAARGLQIGNMTLDATANSVEISLGAETLRPELTPTEFRLLHHLAKHEGRIQSREQLLNVLGGDRSYSTDRTIDAHLSRLRKKISGCTHMIDSVYGIGYRLVKARN